MTEIKINVTDIEEFIESGDSIGTMDKFLDKLGDITTMLREEQSPNFIIGKVVIVNDIEYDEDEESEDDESEDTTQQPKEG